MTAYSQSVNTRKLSVMSLIKMPLVICLVMAFVKMLFIRVAVSLVILVGLVTGGTVLGCT